MTPDLARRTVRVTALLISAQGVALFASAGSLAYWNAWLYLALQTLTMGATNTFLYYRDPQLLDRRLASEEAGERDPVQRWVLRVLRVAALAMLIAAGLEWRLGDRTTPIGIVLLGAVLIAAGAALIVRVFVESTYTSSVIEVTDGQRVVSTGPYRWVRHPMYVGVVVMGFGTPLALGSLWAALVIPPMFAVLVLRIVREERFLRAHLPGYDAYIRSTRARLVPGIW
ncbi:MAG TPA: isoprenylcysteine carboxylmethyltransferase family protein [Polyangiaceae bacterium]|jgi:protein-S-isoprenylcysteine O-methyltransferase Ste14|nr:isoprenylcysteine carboxylmethyltransferase family protein [Polyangiaceae bacterium]